MDDDNDSDDGDDGSFHEGYTDCGKNNVDAVTHHDNINGDDDSGGGEVMMMMVMMVTGKIITMRMLLIGFII